MDKFKALACGLAVGVVVLEALLALADFLAAGPGLPTALTAGTIGPGWAGLLLTAALAGSAAAAAMATAMGGSRLIGCIAGGLLACPLVLVFVLAGSNDHLPLAALAVIVLGSGAGVMLAARAIRTDSGA